MLMVSALTNHWVHGVSGHHGYASNNFVGYVKALAWNHSVIKGKQFLPIGVVSTDWQINRAAQKNSSNNKWWETDMKANMKNIKSQQELVEQLLKAGNSLIVVQFLSPRCPACKALHSKVHQYAGMHPELQFLLVNIDEHRGISKRFNIKFLPMFRFYTRGEGRICNFSCTISTIHKLKDALKRHGVQTENLEAEKRLADSDLKSSTSSTDDPNKIDDSENMDDDVGPSVKDAGISWGLDGISLNFFSIIVKAKEQTQHQFFMELFSIAARELTNHTVMWWQRGSYEQ